MSNDPDDPPYERTVLRPGRQPEGGRGGPPRQARGASSAEPPPLVRDLHAELGSEAPPVGKVEPRFVEDEPELHGPEPLVAAASRLIRLGGKLRTIALAPDLPKLRHLVIRERNAFAARAQRLGLNPATIQLADYILCAFIDDSVLTTPWGNGSAWSRPSLLAAYHGDVRGGDCLFNVAQQMELDPRREQRVLELLYQCLSLGFEGRAALLPHGQTLLGRHRDGLHDAMVRLRPALPGDLSPQWRGRPTAASMRTPLIPLWAALAAIALLALLIFSVLYLRLAAQTEDARVRLNEAVGTQVLHAPPPPAPTREIERMHSILEPDIRAGIVKIRREGGDVIIQLVNRNVFASGTADLAGDLQETFAHIAEAAGIAGGTLRISGHTDNQPVKPSLPYPSNEALSVARAEAVKRALGTAGIPAGQMITSGEGDSQPLADNSTPEGRQENRRVEIRVASHAAWE